MDPLWPLLIFVGWFVLCGAVGKYAENKGRNGIGIFFLSLFLSPLVGFVVALAMSPDEKRVATAQGKKRCPECAEFVQPEAKICRFCQHKFTEAEQLAAAGTSAGPPCPKCGSISTFSYMEKVKASRWWKQARAPFLRCRKCGKSWQPENSTPSESLGDGPLLAVLMLGLVLGLGILSVLIPKHPSGNVGSPTSVSTVPTPSAKPSETNWRIDESTNSMDGIKTTVLMNGHGNPSIFIRFKGRQLEAYVTTPEMVGYDDTSVRVRFDDGKPVAQSWSRSEDYHALFSPNPRWLVTKLQASKKFYIEYHPYEKVPETLSFDVTGLVVPKALLDTYDKQHQQERAAWRKKFDACMEMERHTTASVETEAEMEDYCRATTH
jgi:hypothetical protein